MRQGREINTYDTRIIDRSNQMNTTELGSRRLHVWRGRHHGSTRPHGLVDAVKEDTATLAEAIVEAVELFNAGGQLVQLDPTGKIIPINRAGLHGLVSKHIAAVRVVNVGTADPPTWKAGDARVIITPEKAMWMSGYIRDKPAEPFVNDTAQDLASDRIWRRI
jgi:hypothetical protein